MSELEKLALIDAERLSGEFYVESLIREAAAHGLLSDGDVEGVQLGCIDLLSRGIDDYTLGDSSSVRVEIAQSIMSSNLYTIGLRLKAFRTPDDAADALRSTPVKTLFDGGRELLYGKIAHTKSLYARVLTDAPRVKTLAYDTTLADIGRFIGAYNPHHPKFAAHSVPTADYPLCDPVTDLAGIEFVARYLENLRRENAFCALFADADINRVMSSFGADYRELPLNVFEQVLTAAIKCALAGRGARTLSLPANAAAALRRELSGKSRDEKAALNAAAYARLCEDFGVECDAYVARCATVVDS
ncbi:MAG: DUF6179 domain-containing protein [Oscillospiraceae bacterium]|jgi:hypothetical protein|nr:DUF6179 domain-containing protein [Oscillospiraceae bacterium]